MTSRASVHGTTWRLLAAVVVGGGLAVVGPYVGGVGAQSSSCVGDCDQNGAVDAVELLGGVELILGGWPPGRCDAFDRDGDQVVKVDELLAAIAAAASDCAPPTPTPPISVCGGLVSSVPVLCDFEIVPNPVAASGASQLAFGVADLEGDIDTICLGIAPRGVEPGLFCGSVPPAGVIINVMTQLPAVPNTLPVGDYTAALEVGDQAGHVSNRVSTDFAVVDVPP